MTLLRRIFGGRSGSRGAGSSKQMFIVDATGFIEKRFREPNGQASPRDNYAVLRNISQFVHREGLSMAAVFVGRPLREAGEGDSFKGVDVHYAADEKTLLRKILELARAVGSSTEAVVVTDDRHIEREAAKIRATCMRVSTFRKGMEGNGDHERPPRQFQRRGAPQPEAGQPPSPPPAVENAPAEEKEKAGKNVLDLIDPV